MAVVKFDFYRSDGTTLQYSNRFFSKSFLRKNTFSSTATSGDFQPKSRVYVPIDINSEDISVYYCSATFNKSGTYLINNQWVERIYIDGPAGTTLEQFVFSKVRDDRGTPGTGFRAYHRTTQEVSFSTFQRPLIVSAKLEGYKDSSVGLPGGRKFGAILSNFSGRRYLTWDEGYQDDNQKPPVWYFNGTYINNVYGIQIQNGAAYVREIPVGSGGETRTGSSQGSRPADTLDFDIPLNKFQLVDVTGL